jgi:hypothetical protein
MDIIIIGIIVSGFIGTSGILCTAIVAVFELKYGSKDEDNMASRGMVKTNEVMEVFSENCLFKHCESGCCTHPDKIIAHCINEKKYCPRVAKSDQKDKPLWKTDYEIYLQEHDEIYDKVIMSDAFINPLELRYPKINIRATIAENRSYWRSKKPNKGYRRKCRTDTKEIDWPGTYKRGVDRSVRNRFAIPKETASW